MSECAHDLRFDGDDVVCSKCGERRDAITGATIPSAPAVTDQQSAEVEARCGDPCPEAPDLPSCELPLDHGGAWHRNRSSSWPVVESDPITILREAGKRRIADALRTGATIIPETEKEQARALDALAQRIETLTRERDALKRRLMRITEPDILRAEAQRDRLAEALGALWPLAVHQADAPIRTVWYRVYRSSSYEPTNAEARIICDRVRELENGIARATGALSEIEQAASSESHRPGGSGGAIGPAHVVFGQQQAASNDGNRAS